MIRKDWFTQQENQRNRTRAQAVVEFALILPIALMLVFVIIELARMFQAWLVVTNSARIGLRYAVTGAYEPEHCTPSIDFDLDGLICALEPDKDERNAEIDAARLLSIYERTEHSANGIMKDLSVTDKTQPGYFHVTVCSTNDGRLYHPPPDDYCDPDDHPGDPSEGQARVLVAVTFEHPIILPFVNKIAPSVTLHAERTGIVEQFRVARVLGLPPVIDVPTVTFPPTSTEAPTMSPTPSPTPDCTLYTFSNFGIEGSNRPVVQINNNSSQDVSVTYYRLDWDSAEAWSIALGYPRIRIDWFDWEGNRFYGGDDFDSYTEAGANESLPASSSGVWTTDIDFDGESTWTIVDEFGLTQENFGFYVQLSNGCVIDRPAVPRPTPTPSCDYEIGDFYFGNYAHTLVDITNNDATGTRVTNIEFNWDFAESFDVLVEPADELNVDYLNYGGRTTWGNGDGGVRDYDSFTSTSLDAPDSFPGNWSSYGLPPFAPGLSYTLDVDFDNEWPTFSNDVIPDDFGVRVTFENGCVVEKLAVPRPLPSANCDLYSMSGFSIQPYNRIRANVTNGDILSTEVERIVLDWDYAEAMSDLMLGPDVLYSDWMQWDGAYIWSDNGDGVGDLASVTDTSSDSPGAWMGPGDFNAGDTVQYQVDFDFATGSEYDVLQGWGIAPSDFGVTFYFANGCVLESPPVRRPLATPMPTCNDLVVDNVRLYDDDFEIHVTNNNFIPAYLIDSTLVWPAAAPSYVNYIQFSGVRYYDGDAYTSPVNVAPNPPVELGSNSGSWWEADFNNGLNYGYYQGELTFNLGDLVCVLVADIDLVAPTPTPTTDPNATPTPTRTLRPSATNTPVPTATLSPTITRTPTRTPTPTITRTPSRTPTSAPPSITVPPSPTSDEVPTNTPEPTQPGGG